MKVCSKCNISKNLEEFPNNKNHKDGKHVWCKSCKKEYNILNKEKINNQRKEYDKIYYEENKEKILKYFYSYNSKRQRADINYKLRARIRSRFYHSIFGNYKSKSVIELLGCDIENFKVYLESLFSSEMSWSNYGIVWEIDHIIPCSKFNLVEIEEQKKCFHYSNQEPRFKTTLIAESFGYNNIIGNRNKGSKIL